MRPTALSVIGLGAIGGSLAWQARRAGIDSVVGYAPDRADGVEALRSGAVRDISDSAVRAVKGADLVVLAAPPQAILALLDQLAPALAPDTIVTDVASIKAPMVARARAAGLAARFAGSHPFAGTHLSGWAGARPDLFRGAVVYVTPTGPEGDDAAREIRDFWEGVMGAHAVPIDAEDHDRRLAWTSHLPQAVASLLAHTLAREPSLHGAAYGTGMRDTTRLAASPAEMWVDIFLLNHGPVGAALARMEGELAVLRQLVSQQDRPGLYAFLEEAALFRRRLDPGPPPVR